MPRLLLHRIDRELIFLSSRLNWNSPTPLHAGECVSSSPLVLGGGPTDLRERGWMVPVPMRGQTLWYSRHICTLWGGSVTKGLLKTCPLQSNAHISTHFFQKTVFFSKIFFSKPPSKLLEVCLNSEYV
jgi:hypothetical protein